MGSYEPVVAPYKFKNIAKFREYFQKPSQIYKFLREAWIEKPVFLVRNLSFYNKHRVHLVPRETRKRTIDEICESLPLKIPSKIRHHPDICQSNCSCFQGLDPARETKPQTGCYYNWICDDSERTSQLTKSLGFGCPWCERNYLSLDSVMIHLKSTHQRLSFNLSPELMRGKSVVEITLNKLFDGSYCGFKYPGHNLKRDFQFYFGRPAYRTPRTRIIYFKHKHRKTDTYLNVGGINSTVDSEAFAVDDEVDVDVCSGRLYYHTSTCLPTKPNEVDIDSEAEMDPEWLKERTKLMIDEFTDVNEGEKEILKLWNLHMMRNYKYKGDNHIRQACLDFVEEECNNIISKNLYKNFVLHLVNLHDFGLLSSADVYECSRKVRERKSKVNIMINPYLRTSLLVRRKRTSSEHCQRSPPAKRALLN